LARLAKPWFNQEFCVPPKCPGGGTGRRAGFRYQWSNSWRFESSPGHQFLSGSFLFELAKRKELKNCFRALAHLLSCRLPALSTALLLFSWDCPRVKKVILLFGRSRRPRVDIVCTFASLWFFSLGMRTRDKEVRTALRASYRLTTRRESNKNCFLSCQLSPRSAWAEQWSSLTPYFYFHAGSRVSDSIERVLQNDRFKSIWSRRDDGNWRSDENFESTQVGLRCLGQVFE
jgi:hypothetical protein